jgi:hypothetical protein
MTLRQLAFTRHTIVLMTICLAKYVSVAQSERLNDENTFELETVDDMFKLHIQHRLSNEDLESGGWPISEESMHDKAFDDVEHFYNSKNVNSGALLINARRNGFPLMAQSRIPMHSNSPGSDLSVVSSTPDTDNDMQTSAETIPLSTDPNDFTTNFYDRSTTANTNYSEISTVSVLYSSSYTLHCL